MAHEAEIHSSTLPSAPLSASSRRKRLILLCGEDLRPMACALEAALRSRGWTVDVEFGADARPWVQRVPPGRPSVRVLCVPGTVDRSVADQLRAAFRPDPEADLHILGVDDSPSVVQEIERLAGVRTPPRRPPSVVPRPSLPLPTRVRPRERSWRVGATSALVAFAISLGTLGAMRGSTPAPALASADLAASLTIPVKARPADLDAESSRFHDPVLAAMGPVDVDALDVPRLDDDVEIVLLDDVDALDHRTRPPEEPRPLDAATGPTAAPEGLRQVDVLATPLASEPALALIEPVTSPATEPTEIARPRPMLPPGFLPVGGLPISDAATPQRRHPDGLLPVTGITAAPPVTTVDPFASIDVGSAAPVVTVDPFGSTTDITTTAP